MLRLAVVASHPIQYHVPLYQNLAKRGDLAVKVFFTLHAAEKAVVDPGFQRPVAWDIPLTDGYDYELVPNVAADPGTHHFFGLQNPTLTKRVLSWAPDIVHVSGWAWASHLNAMRSFHQQGTPTLFRGDSHLLDEANASIFRRLAKRALLSRVFAWPSAFLVAGEANRQYYKAFGVGEQRLFSCPPSIDVARFAEPNEAYEKEARSWRQALGIGDNKLVILFAGKFEPKKDPLGLMKAVIARNDKRCVLVMVGGGVLQKPIENLAREAPDTVRILPFQNQSKMPVVYRLGDLFVLPSLYGESWGLAVNEALASGRPVLVSSRVGCAKDVIVPECGWVFEMGDQIHLMRALDALFADPENLANLRVAARSRARSFDIQITADAMLSCLHRMGLQ